MAFDQSASSEECCMDTNLSGAIFEADSNDDLNDDGAKAPQGQLHVVDIGFYLDKEGDSDLDTALLYNNFLDEINETEGSGSKTPPHYYMNTKRYSVPEDKKILSTTEQISWHTVASETKLLYKTLGMVKREYVEGFCSGSNGTQKKPIIAGSGPSVAWYEMGYTINDASHIFLHCTPPQTDTSRFIYVPLSNCRAKLSVKQRKFEMVEWKNGKTSKSNSGVIIVIPSLRYDTKRLSEEEKSYILAQINGVHNPVVYAEYLITPELVEGQEIPEHGMLHMDHNVARAFLSVAYNTLESICYDYYELNNWRKFVIILPEGETCLAFLMGCIHKFNVYGSPYIFERRNGKLEYTNFYD